MRRPRWTTFALAAAGGADVAVTAYGLGTGWREMSPHAAPAYALGGVAGLVAIKVAWTIAVVGYGDALRHSRHTVRLRWLAPLLVWGTVLVTLGATVRNTLLLLHG